ncbi:MAG: hypothetical protein ACYS74_14215 [Planctomycetota bacterium]|jgi:hypothetical protein
MAQRNRSSQVKREREQRKRERQQRKAEKAVQKRERRFRKDDAETIEYADQHIESPAEDGADTQEPDELPSPLSDIRSG